MSLVTRSLWCLVTAAALVMTTVVLVTPVTASTAEPPLCDPQEGVAILLLYDVSGSLRGTDPAATRRDGGLAALRELERLQSDYSARFSVAVDSFASAYDSSSWVTLTSGSDGAGDGLRSRIADIGADNSGTSTDYGAALEGAAQRFIGLPAEACKRLVWFTDGGHDTVPRTSDRLTAAESLEIDALCAPSDGAAGILSRLDVWVSAVYLSPSRGSEVTEPLRRLFGQSHLACPAPLLGEIVDVPDVSGLAQLLGERIEDQGFEAVENPPPPQPCDAVRGTQVEECVFSFTVEREAASFEMYVDLQNVPDSDTVAMLLRSPSGRLDEARFGDERAMQPATGFELYAATSNWRKITGHQAAEFATGRGPAPWEWTGEWQLVFRGTGSQLARVTPPRITSSGLPQLDANYDADHDLLQGTVSVGRGQVFEGHIRLGLDAPQDARDGAPIGHPDGYSVQAGAWSVPRLGAAVAEALDGEPVANSTNWLVPVSAQLVQTVDWAGESGIQWRIPNAVRRVFVTPAGTIIDDGRRCHALSDDGRMECSFSFALSDTDESFTIFIEPPESQNVSWLDVSLLPPSGETAHLADFRQRNGAVGSTGFRTDFSSGVLRLVGHQVGALDRDQGSPWEWAGEWQLLIAGSFEDVTRVETPTITLDESPALVFDFDSTADVLGGTVTHPAGAPLVARVLLSVDAPETGQHELPVGHPDGYLVRDDGWGSSDWGASNATGLLMEVPGMRALLRQREGQVPIAAQLVKSVAWAGSDEPIQWPVPTARQTVHIEVSPAAGWSSEHVHPSVADVTPVEASTSSGAARLNIEVRPGAEAGTLHLTSAERLSSETAYSFELPEAWMCFVPAVDELPEEFSCPDLEVLIDTPADIDVSLTLTFASRLEAEDELIAAAEEYGLGNEVRHLYRPALQTLSSAPFEARVAEIGQRIAYFVVLMLVLVAVAVAARLLGRRRSR